MNAAHEHSCPYVMRSTGSKGGKGGGTSSGLGFGPCGLNIVKPKLYDSKLDNSVTLENLKTSLTNNYDRFPNGNLHGRDKAIVIWDGYRRLSMMEELVIDTIRNNVDGDIAEAGVWRGGMTIFFAGIVKEYNCNKKIINLDSFRGCPSIDKTKEQTLHLGNSGNEKIQAFDKKWENKLIVTLDDVKDNFRKFNLLGANIIFVEGYFCNTLPNLDPNMELSILRVDCDLYQSTYEVLEYLYPKLSIGGYVVFDDYKFPESRQAILDYREKNNIRTECFLGKTFDDILYWKKDSL